MVTVGAFPLYLRITTPTHPAGDQTAQHQLEKNTGKLGPGNPIFFGHSITTHSTCVRATQVAEARAQVSQFLEYRVRDQGWFAAHVYVFGSEELTAPCLTCDAA